MCLCTLQNVKYAEQSFLNSLHGINFVFNVEQTKTLREYENGKGWVYKTATVETSAYVGPDTAKVDK